jgi:hypothetical protein
MDTRDMYFVALGLMVGLCIGEMIGKGKARPIYIPVPVQGKGSGGSD